MAGWGEFFGNLGKLFGKIPLQGRRERWRNQIDQLTKERKELLRGSASEKTTKRVLDIDAKLDKLNGLLKNAESD